MLEIISEWSTIYFKVGACFGFGIGAIAQCFKGLSRPWTLGTAIIITALWPLMFWNAWHAEKE